VYISFFFLLCVHVHIQACVSGWCKRYTRAYANTHMHMYTCLEWIVAFCGVSRVWFVFVCIYV
jgi:hypothetical protein